MIHDPTKSDSSFYQQFPDHIFPFENISETPENLEKLNGLEFHLYQTGLEPAVIGTYRAILEILRKSDSKYRDKLIVIPKMFRGHKNGFQDLKAWY